MFLSSCFRNIIFSSYCLYAYDTDWQAKAAADSNAAPDAAAV